MLKKLKRRVSRVASHIIANTLQKRKKKKNQQEEEEGEGDHHQQQTPPPLPPPPPPPPPLSLPSINMQSHHRSPPFLFPKTQSPVLPDPSPFFSPHLLSSPLPTNSFFQNFVLKKGDQPEYIHPYLINSANNSLSLCYPSRFATPNFIYQTFTPDLTITAASSTNINNNNNHIISSFDDLSVTLDLPPSLRFFLVRGSPFLTFTTLSHSPISISSSTSSFASTSSNSSYTKHTLTLSNNKTYLLYSSAPIQFSSASASLLAADSFYGVVRIAYLPDPSLEPVLDRFSSCYPVSGDASFSTPFRLDYTYQKKGWGDLLLLAHPLHLRLLSNRQGTEDCPVTVLEDFKYNGIDGELVGVVGHSWVLQTDPVPVTWHSARGVAEEGLSDIVSALAKDVDGLKSAPITTASSYFYGKAVARAARFALIGEEVGFPDVVPAVRDFLRSAITPWLDGSFNGNGFLHDGRWGGIVTRLGSADSGADFGFGIYNDHHYHLGYFLYGIAVLAKLDPAWGRKYRPQAYSMMADFMTLSRKPHASYTRLRCFDLWKLHSWAGGLTEFGDGRNQESTSEAVNAYYSAALMGLSYGDTNLATIGSTLASFEIAAAETWWHVREGEGMYEDDFSRENRVVGVLWNNKRDSGLWFAPPEWKECRLGIQVLPLLPVTEALFRDVGFVQELVKWTMPALAREGVGEGWKGFVYAMEGVYNKQSALEKTKGLNGFDDGNSLSNLLWWIYSRAEEEGGVGWTKGCWFGHYCH
ncbi:putative endo-1,3(4)-beta-glucanase [Iris pallida]|uniref:glucan endo-1,3-beta-D-glucosidase n=1 Tax=Iris pallida TaxID=29817 RepID=A0AAX6GZ99_IRIPA|nr:putative endo-1,3(4)-beta-glucanase [Iris pallida]